MTSSYTTNKVLEKPANGDYVDTWNVPVNRDMDIIDQAFGGITSLNATGGSATLTSTQYRSLILSVSGAMTADVTYTLPTGIGGQWIVINSTTDSTGGPWVVRIATSGGNSVVALRSSATPIYSTGSAVGISSPPLTAGSTTQVVYNSGGTLTGSANLTFDGTTLTLNALSVTNNAAVGGNATVTGTITATGAVTSGGVIKSTSGGFTFPDNTNQTTAAPTTPIPSVQVFTSSGTFTVPTGKTSVRVIVVGGGAGGDALLAGGGGGAGGTAIKVITGLTPGATITATIGSAGTIGNNGGSSSFGAYCSATGGSAGAFYQGGDGGVGSGGDINIKGGGGGGGGGGYNQSGVGGGSYLGGGGYGKMGGYGGAGGN